MSRRSPRIWRRISGSTSRAFAPSQILGLVFAVDAAAGITLNGSNVSAWADQSGTGDANKNATQGTGANQPAFNASNASFGNQPTVDFGAGANQSLATGVWSVQLSQPYTIWVVGKYSDELVSHVFASDDNRGGESSNSASSASIYAGGAAPIHSGVSMVPPGVLFGIYNGASSSVAVNARTPQTIGNPGAAGLGQHYTLGNVSVIQGQGAPLNGSMALLYVWGRVLTAGEIDRLATYTTNRFGIAVAA